MGSFDQGFAYGMDIAQRHAQLGEQKNLLDFQTKVQDLASTRNALQTKYSATLDKEGKPTPETQGVLDQLQQNASDIRELFHPDKNPGAIERFGHLLTDALHITKPAPKITTEVGAITVPGAPPTNPDSAKGTSASAESAPPSLGAGPGVSLPGQKVTITEVPQKQFDKQQALQAKNLAADREAAQQAAAGAPIGPLQESAMKADAANEAWLSLFDAKMKQLRQADPNMSPEEAQRATLELMGVRLTSSLKPPMMLKLADGTETLAQQDPNGVWRYPDQEEIPLDLLKGAQMMPKASPAPHTILNQEQDAYAKSYGFGEFSQLPPELQYAAQQFVQQQAKLATEFGRATRSTSHIQDIDGNIRAFTVLNYSTPTGVVHLRDPLSGIYVQGASTPTKIGAPGAGKTDTSGSAPPSPTSGARSPSGRSTPKTKESAAPSSPYAKVGEPLVKGRTPATDADFKAARAAYSGYQEVLKEASNTTPVDSQDMVMTWLKGRVNRVTATEIQAVRNLGGAFQKFDGNVSSILHGTMTPEQISWFVKSAKERYDVAQQVWDQDKSMGAAPPDADTTGTGGFDWNNPSQAPVHQGGR